MYISGVVPWKSSSWVAPPPEEIARIRKEAGTELGAPTDIEDQIQQHRSREQDAAALAAAEEKERELERSSEDTAEQHEAR